MPHSICTYLRSSLERKCLMTLISTRIMADGIAYLYLVHVKRTEASQNWGRNNTIFAGNANCILILLPIKKTTKTTMNDYFENSADECNLLKEISIRFQDDCDTCKWWSEHAIQTKIMRTEYRVPSTRRTRKGKDR